MCNIRPTKRSREHAGQHHARIDAVGLGGSDERADLGESIRRHRRWQTPEERDRTCTEITSIAVSITLTKLPQHSGWDEWSAAGLMLCPSAC